MDELKKKIEDIDDKNTLISILTLIYHDPNIDIKEHVKESKTKGVYVIVEKLSSDTIDAIKYIINN